MQGQETAFKVDVDGKLYFPTPPTYTCTRLPKNTHPKQQTHLPPNIGAFIKTSFF